MLPLSRAIAQRAATRLARGPVQRRLMSSGPAPTTTTSSSTAGAATENSFIREREAVREHAAQTAGLWLKISLYVVPISLIAAGANAYYLWNKHWEHWDHMPPLEERVEYSYQNIRTKNYPWGDGDKTLFWNSKVNYHNKDKTA